MAATSPNAFLGPRTIARGLVVSNSTVKRPVYGFFGVPYAQPPIGPLRFQPTKSIPLWDGHRSFDHYGKVFSYRKYLCDLCPY